MKRESREEKGERREESVRRRVKSGERRVKSEKRRECRVGTSFRSEDEDATHNECNESLTAATTLPAILFSAGVYMFVNSL